MQTFFKIFSKFLQCDCFYYICCMETFKHGSLFSGIGGFDLAAEWMGWENVFHCEWNEFGQKVLKYYWPEAKSFTDITKSDFTHYANKIDILTGGFPCQPYSTAGKRKGKDDERHLWPEMLRAIREISPRYVVGENVRGLTNWNGGLVFDEVCAELEALGYQVAPVIIPACGVNAPHRRERIWFVAYNNSVIRRKGRESKFGKQPRYRKSNESCYTKINGATTNTNGTEQRNNAGSDNREAEEIRWENESDVSREFCSYGDVANANGKQLQKSEQDGELERGRFKLTNKRNDWEGFPTQSPICGGNDGLPSELDGITFPKWRNESIKGYGNAIVPQVAYEIFKAIERLEKDFEM
jgi:DNA (cytosine-5)-methyltransferase 1